MEHKTGHLIKIIQEGMEKRANNNLRQKDLTFMQMNVLVTLHFAKDEKMTMKELERKYGVAQSTISGIVNRLEQKGLVSSYYDPSDKRIKIVTIEKSGLKILQEGYEDMLKSEAQLVHGFSEEEKKEFDRLLLKAWENIK